MRQNSSRKSLPKRLFALLFTISLVGAACSKDDKTATTLDTTQAPAETVEATAETEVASTESVETPATETTESVPAQVDSLAAFQKEVADRWTEATGPVEGFDHAQGPALLKGKSVGAACLGSQITACVQWWEQVEEIGTLIGWDVTTYDGKIDVAVWNEQLTRMAGAGHDGLLIFGGLPSLSAEGYNAIKASGLPLVGMTSDDPEGVPTLKSRLDGGIANDNYEIGYLQGIAAFTLGKGKVHAIGGYDGSEISVAREKGFQAFIDKCVAAGGDCWAKLRPTDTAQMFTQIETFCPSLAQSNPDFNVMISQVDDITAICVDAIKAAGLVKDGDFGIGVDYNAIGSAQIATTDVFQASVGIPYPSGAWQGVDELNRLLSGEDALGRENRPWPKRIFFDGNDDKFDQSSKQPWDVQLGNPKAFYSNLWGLK
jgi:ABC-type sugar transport system substrate-binding protein